MPDEILVTVFEYVKGCQPDTRRPTFTYEFGVSEIKNVRLTCRRFCNASSHLLLPLVRVFMTSASVNALDRISQHPIISKGVRAVRVVLDYYDSELANDIALFAEYTAANLRDTADRLEWSAVNGYETPTESDMESIRRARAFEPLLMGFAHGAVHEPTFRADLRNQDLIRRAHEEYKSRTADQNQVCDHGAFVSSVATAIGRMPLATRLEFRNCNLDSARFQQDFSFRERDDDHFIWLMLLPMMWSLRRKGALEMPHVDVLFDLPRAVYEAGTVLKILDLQIYSFNGPNDALTAEQIRRLSATVRQVRNIGTELRGTLSNAPS